MKKWFFSVLALFFFFGDLSAQDYIVGEGDILKITVYDHPDLVETVRVTGDGSINFPLIGDVKVSGLTVAQISQTMSDRLADGYIVDPHVSVFVAEFKSKKTTIMGQVNKPGIYVLSGHTTFLELLSNAGGLSKEAGERAFIKRRAGAGGVEESVITIDLKRLIELGDTSLDVLIMDNDSVYVSKAGLVYVTGEVKKPDAYRHEDGMTVIKAVTMAGGFSDKASAGRVRIVRKVEGRERVMEKAGMDEPVFPDDIVIVPESFF